MNQPRQLTTAGLLAIAVAFGFTRYGYGLFVPEFRGAFGLSTEALGSSRRGLTQATLQHCRSLVARVGLPLPVVTGGLSAAGMSMGLLRFRRHFVAMPHRNLLYYSCLVVGGTLRPQSIPQARNSACIRR